MMFEMINGVDLMGRNCFGFAGGYMRGVFPSFYCCDLTALATLFL
jgi:hypothetical protein